MGAAAPTAPMVLVSMDVFSLSTPVLQEVTVPGLTWKEIIVSCDFLARINHKILCYRSKMSNKTRKSSSPFIVVLFN